MHHELVDSCYVLKFDEDKPYISVSEASKVFKKDPSWVRAGIVEGWLPIGIAIRNGKRITDIQEVGSKKGRINFYISPKKLYEFTGYGRKRGKK